MELCKRFAQSLATYAKAINDGTEEGKSFMKYAVGFTGRKRREGILSDARSIQPMSLELFDRNKTLVNCINGTYSLTDMVLLPHNPTDYITKLARVKYIEGIMVRSWYIVKTDVY